MATWFEIRAAEGDPDYVQQACAEAFRAIDELEGRLSRYRESSETSAVSRLAAGESVVVHPDTFRCLELALEMAELTGGAFDPTLGAAVDRQRAGVAHVHDLPGKGRLYLDPVSRAVACETAPVPLDLGAIGKGYALDRTAELLAEWEIGPFLLIAGGSSILAVEGAAPSADSTSIGKTAAVWDLSLTDEQSLRLMQGSVGCSGLSVKGSHILDPRTGEPAQTPARAWALAAQAAVSDALSTAFMILSRDEIALVCNQRPEVAAVLQPDATSPAVERLGRGLGVRHQFTRPR